MNRVMIWYKHTTNLSKLNDNTKYCFNEVFY